LRNTRDVIDHTSTVATHPQLHLYECIYPATRRTALVSMLLLVTAMASTHWIAGGGTAAYAETLHWVGCDISKASFMDDVATAFAQKTGHRIALEDGGATRGIRDVVAGKAEMGGSCRHGLDIPEERGVKLIPVAWDALVAIVHPSNPVAGITREQLRGVLTGEISHWKELGGQDVPIQIFERKGKMSGVGFGTRLLLFGNPDQEFTPTARIFDSTRPLEDALEQTPNALAMTGISSARLRQVKMLAIEGRSPTRENVINGQYLLYRPLYLTVPEQPSPVVSQFIKFLFSREGQAIIKSTGTVTLAEGKQLWEAFKQPLK
jgi:phosphate transport system substrate-binding protein